MVAMGRVVAGAPIPSLVRWGRSADADLLYRALVTCGAHSAEALAAELGISRRRVCSALEELRAIGAVVIDDARLWWARPPADVLARVHRRGRVVDPAGQHQRHRQVVGDLLPAPVVALGDGIRHLPSRLAARERLAELVAGARHEHLVMNTEQVPDTASVRGAAPIHATVQARKLRARVIGPPRSTRTRRRQPGRPPSPGSSWPCH